LMPSLFQAHSKRIKVTMKRPENIPTTATWNEDEQLWELHKVIGNEDIGWHLPADMQGDLLIEETKYWTPEGRLYLHLGYQGDIDDDDYLWQTYFPPAHVPAEATWNEEDMEWQLGERNQQEQKIGQWKYWQFPSGYLICETTFEHGLDTNITRYHPNGEIAYVENAKETYWQRSTQDTNEFFFEQDCPFDHAWQARRRPNYSPLTVDYFDKQGVQIKNSADIEHLRVGAIEETAIAAIKRLKKVIKLVKKDLNDEGKENIVDSYTPHFHAQITQQELATQEKKLGIKLPPSYTEFVLAHGLVIFGKYSECCRKMFPEFSRLLLELECQWEINPETDCTAQRIKKLNNMITFSYGDEGLQIVWYHCFDFNTLNPDTGEVSIIDFCQDECYYIGETDYDMCQSKGFDDHMRYIVDEAIEEIVDEYCS